MKRRRLDSEDDEDEYIPSAMRGEDEQLEPFAATTGFRNVMHEMGLDLSSSSTSINSSEENHNSEISRHHLQHVDPSTGDTPAAPSSTEKTLSECFRCSQIEDDLDIPSEWIGILSDPLLAVYCVPLTYFQGNRQMDDKLLAQYMPFSASLAEVPLISAAGGGSTEGAEINPGTSSFGSHRYQNLYGISPGWRWDGVIRGRKKTQ